MQKPIILSNMQHLNTENQHPAQKPLILAVETSGRIGSVAIAAADKILAHATFSAPLRHSAEIFTTICALFDQRSLKPAQLDHIYISAGPGSFTGLRIAVTIAKTMNLANNTAIVAVDTLDVIAENATDYIDQSGITTPRIAAILDAKRGQFFIAAYRKKENQWIKSLPDRLMTPAQFLDKFGRKNQPIWLLGEGLVYYKSKFHAQAVRFIDEDFWRPKAEKVHLLGRRKAKNGQFADPLTLKPAYLRIPEAEEKFKN